MKNNNTSKDGHIPLVEITRGRMVESRHYGSAVIVDVFNKTIGAFGDPNLVCFLRSSAKPFQALAFLERGGADYYKLSLQEIAILCSSHSGTDEHVHTLQQLQQKIGMDERDLQCGVHPPFDQATNEQLIKRGEKPTPNRHDCSGKHTGMLAFAKMINAAMDDYLNLDHPIQQAILDTFAEMCEINKENIHLGIDGCSAPVFAIPLINAALGYAHLCQPDGLIPPRAEACRLITQAMTAHPEMVAGPCFFDTKLMSAAKDIVISKSGAEGYLSLGIMPNTLHSGNAAMGIAIKISDGDLSLRAGPIVAITLLKQLGLLPIDKIKSLEKFDSRPIFNWRGLEVGEIRPAKDLVMSTS